MDIKKLLSGIAVVIDDQLDSTSEEKPDIVNNVVDWFEENWKIQFVKQKYLPVDDDTSSNLLSFASFVLLDWKLWGQNGDYRRGEVIKDIEAFLKCATKYLVPVIILTNEAPEDIKNELEKHGLDLSDGSSTFSHFVIIERKADFWNLDECEVKLDNVVKWVYQNPSIYALKTWNNVLDKAKNEMFKVMCDRNVYWPQVFWKNFSSDGVDPSISLTELISSNMLGRMQKKAFASEYLQPKSDEDILDSNGAELKSLIIESSVLKNEDFSESEIRCGDLFKHKGKFLLNLRPDCDCIPRNVEEDIKLYCIEGTKIKPDKLLENGIYDSENGRFNERIDNAIVLGAIDGNCIDFRFKKLQIIPFSAVKNKRKGRLIHPYITRIQQRFGLYIQRQGLPRIPKEALTEL